MERCDMTELNPGTTRLLPRAPALSWWTLLITTLAILMISVDHGILPAVLPAIQQQYGIGNAEAGLINSVYFAGLVAGGLIFGYVADRIGTGYRRTWTWNVAMLIGIVGGALTYGLAGSYLAFLLLRIPMGLSRGGSEPVNVALVSEWWPKEHRGFAIGVHHTGFPIGQFLTGALIAVVLGAAGWQEAFLVIPLLGIPIIIAQTIIGTRRNQQRVYDWIDDHRLTRPLPELSVRNSGSLLAPVKEALRHANVRWSVVLVFLFLWGEAGAVTFLTVQFTGLGMSNAQAALISGASGITGWIGQVVWGTASDRIGRKFAIVFLILGWAGTLLAMIFISGPTSAWIVLLAWGLFRNAPFPVVYALLIDSVPRAAGTAMGIMIGVALGVSGIFASLVAGIVIDAFGFTWHYVLLAAVCLLGLIPLARITETVAVAQHHS
ncbi:MFS transporter [Enemella evansiae]|uniref:MFS transporter n=2 Tax=Enemella evansiae TaxID=2016499 RepID=A0A255GCI4_9ACTN|nr:MFS transporter [Enemella evansiae]OYO03140.1 MFS transporter [Enemella evansiae]OYO03824.1 MFS transporter [Enemella evansiae]OYO13597.1 MFS transporter [Enemella evansiae]